MTFLTFPLFLGGLAATTVPILLHMLLRGKPKRIEFPALMFIRKRLNVNRRSYRLKHLILLALRILTFVLLGFALARPSIKFADWFPNLAIPGSADSKGFVSTLASSLGSQDAPIAAAIVVDSSLRMDYVAENRNRLDAAKELAHWILSHLPKNSQVAVLSSLREGSVFQVDMLAAEEKINRLQITPLGRPVADAVFEALALLNTTELEQRELYVLSDLSEPGWRSETLRSIRNSVEGIKGPNAAPGKIPTETGLFVVDVGVENPTDAALLKVSLSNQVVAAQTPVDIDVELSHIGNEETRGVELVLLDTKLPDKPIETVRGTRTVEFPHGEARRTLRFPLAGFDSGTQQGFLRFTVPDALVADDRLAFTIDVRPPTKILLLAPPPVPAATLYLRQALETVPFNVETAPIGQLKTMSPKELDGYRAVFLLDPTPLEPSLWKKLADYAAKGRGVGVFLGANADQIESYNDPAATEILGGKLLRQARRPDGDLWIAPDELQTAVLAPFRQYGTRESFPWDAQPVFRYWEMNDLSPQTFVVAPFSDGRPAILTKPVGQGFTLTVPTPVSESPNVAQPWNILTRGEASWMFVLLSEGIAKYLVGESDRNYNFLAGENVILRPMMEMLPATALLATPSGASIRLTPDTVKKEISVAAATEPGNYRIRSGGAKESLDTGFSVNVSGTEMSLRRIGVPQLDQAFGEGNYRLVKTPAEIERGIARRRVGQELYAAVLILLLIVFATEYVFANRFYGSSPETATDARRSQA